MTQYTADNGERQFRSLTDIREYKEELCKQIKQSESHIAESWNELFHKEEEIPKNKAQRLARMLSLGTGVFDGALLGWKLYRKYKEGALLFGFGRNKKRIH